MSKLGKLVSVKTTEDGAQNFISTVTNSLLPTENKLWILEKSILNPVLHTFNNENDTVENTVKMLTYKYYNLLSPNGLKRC